MHNIYYDIQTTDVFIAAISEHLLQHLRCFVGTATQMWALLNGCMGTGRNLGEGMDVYFSANLATESFGQTSQSLRSFTAITGGTKTMSLG